MNNFNWEEFKEDNIAVWCKTEELVNDFLRECDKQNVRWSSGDVASSINCYPNICYIYEDVLRGLIYNYKESCIERGYKIIEWELDEEKDEFTFQEVIAKIKPSEIYNCITDRFNLKNITCMDNGNIRLDFTNNNIGCTSNYEYLTINSLDAKFRLQEPKKTYLLCGVKYQEDGEIYDFRSDDIFEMYDEFVVCDTPQGKSYGRVVEAITKRMTEKEYLQYKKCWRA